MTTLRLPSFPATTPRTGLFALFFIISDHENKITTLPVKPAPSSPDHTPALYGYPLDSGDDSSNKDLSDTADTAFFCRPGKEISMPLGYKAAMDRWRAISPSTCHPLLSLEIPLLLSLPSLLTSSSLPPPSLLPSSSHKRSKSASPSLPSLVSPSPPQTTISPLPKHIESVGDDIEASFWNLERHLTT
nr:hypothetical protein [Tanacetum cinerariifolium]